MIDDRLRRALRAFLPEFFPREPFLGPRKYRLVRMRPSASSATLTRAELQIVNKATGLPDLLMVTIAPGLAGSRSEMTPGCFVLLEFIDGDPGQPIVTHFSTADDPAWKPVNTTIDATGSITIGASATSIVVGAGAGRVLREGDFIVAPPLSAGNPHLQLVIANIPVADPDPSRLRA